MSRCRAPTTTAVGHGRVRPGPELRTAPPTPSRPSASYPSRRFRPQLGRRIADSPGRGRRLHGLGPALTVSARIGLEHQRRRDRRPQPVGPRPGPRRGPRSSSTATANISARRPPAGSPPRAFPTPARPGLSTTPGPRSPTAPIHSPRRPPTPPGWSARCPPRSPSSSTPRLPLAPRSARSWPTPARFASDGITGVDTPTLVGTDPCGVQRDHGLPHGEVAGTTFADSEGAGASRAARWPWRLLVHRHGHRPGGQRQRRIAALRRDDRYGGRRPDHRRGGEGQRHRRIPDDALDRGNRRGGSHRRDLLSQRRDRHGAGRPVRGAGPTNSPRRGAWPPGTYPFSTTAVVAGNTSPIGEIPQFRSCCVGVDDAAARQRVPPRRHHVHPRPPRPGRPGDAGERRDDPRRRHHPGDDEGRCPGDLDLRRANLAPGKHTLSAEATDAAGVAAGLPSKGLTFTA